MPRLSIGECLRMETDILTGWLSCRAGEASRRFPRLASAAKRMLGIKEPARVGATVWSDSQRRAPEGDETR